MYFKCFINMFYSITDKARPFICEMTDRSNIVLKRERQIKLNYSKTL